MIRRPAATTHEGRLADRLASVERRLNGLERRTPIVEVAAWSASSPAAPLGSVVVDTSVSPVKLWVSVGTTWKYVEIT